MFLQIRRQFRGKNGSTFQARASFSLIGHWQSGPLFLKRGIVQSDILPGIDDLILENRPARGLGPILKIYRDHHALACLGLLRLKADPRRVGGRFGVFANSFPLRRLARLIRGAARTVPASDQDGHESFDLPKWLAFAWTT
jgi:hypothetical protein